MSADNGYIIRRNDKDHYVLQGYMMSSDEYPPINDPRGHHFNSLEAALTAYDKGVRSGKYYSEYGLTLDIGKITPNPRKRFDTMTQIETNKFVRKPFEVEAVQVTAKNLEALARWSEGTVVAASRKESRHILVKVNRPQTERQTKAFVGDWLLYSGSGFKVYTPKAFEKSFSQVGTSTVIHEIPEATAEVEVVPVVVPDLVGAVSQLSQYFNPAKPGAASPATMPKKVLPKAPDEVVTAVSVHSTDAGLGPRTETFRKDGRDYAVDPDGSIPGLEY